MQRAGDWRKARRQFARIQYRFPSSTIAGNARRMSAWQHDYHAIQLGAYSDPENAQKQVALYSQAGLPSVRTESRPRQGRAIWIVMTGRYETYNEALSALGHVRAKQSDAHIIP